VRTDFQVTMALIAGDNIEKQDQKSKQKRISRRDRGGTQSLIFVFLCVTPRPLREPEKCIIYCDAVLNPISSPSGANERGFQEI
jgi:hypothetical protein